ncbi:MAG: DNA-3-methyladenine glycosylase [Candidatus Bathyarchaeota archaeon]|nr:DNA-3-methyladenine glycosylase [Candidatus Bathyarchaeota archaeon]
MMLKRDFYQRDPLTVAKELLGKTLVYESSEGVMSGKIVETEAYLGPEDKASHAYQNRRTARTEIQFGPKGHAYLYLIYGMYYCFNVTAGEIPKKPEAVFFRAMEPLEGVEFMKKRRPCAKGDIARLANGPSRLCMALGLSKQQNGTDLCAPPFYIRDDAVSVAKEDIVQTTRIGVDYADEWKTKPWRFYIRGNPFVSVKEKKPARRSAE